MYFQEPTSPSPTLKITGSSESALHRASSELIMDNQLVVATKDLDITECVTCLFAVYYIHGVEYPKGLKNTLLFLERYLFNITNPNKLPVTVVRLHSVLNSVC